MSIIGLDNRLVANTHDYFPLDAVTAIDFQDELGNNSEGSGIVIAPKHTLTVGHNVYDTDRTQKLFKFIRVVTSDEEEELIARGLESSGLGRTDGNRRDPSENLEKRYFPADYVVNSNVEISHGDDIALLETNNSLLSAEEVIGTIAFS